MNDQPPTTLPLLATQLGTNDHNIGIDRERQELIWLVERSLIMHRLAKEHFGHRSLWFQFLPLISITTITTIIGFIISGMAGNNVGQDPQIVEGLSDDDVNKMYNLSILSGILGALSTFLTSVSKHTRYGDRQEMHTMVQQGLQNIGPLLMLGERGMHEDVKKQKAVYLTLEGACTSEIPSKIVQAFNELDDIIKTKDYDFQLLHQRFYNVLWKRFSQHSMIGGMIPLWPTVIANIDVPNSDIGKMIDVEYENFKRNLSSANAAMRNGKSATNAPKESDVEVGLMLRPLLETTSPVNE
mmetsp:Transcript_36819/g.77243  ORF Transcript_36819/g.77243 Transcript_36819/m.77243 type:complete len:298 (+) Transcript_36819:97-990(+)